MNPCPCGYLGDSKRVCKCNPIQIEKYLGRVSGPLLDRIDMHLEVPSVRFEELSAPADGTSSQTMRDQVLAARAIQRERSGDGETLNGRMGSRAIRKFCGLTAEGKSILKNAMEDLGLSARAHDRILRMARTIADLSNRSTIAEPDLYEAINYRTMDRKLWAR
jgi:magnesium chelatase family protein